MCVHSRGGASAWSRVKGTCLPRLQPPKSFLVCVPTRHPSPRRSLSFTPWLTPEYKTQKGGTFLSVAHSPTSLWSLEQQLALSRRSINAYTSFAEGGDRNAHGLLRDKAGVALPQGCAELSEGVCAEGRRGATPPKRGERLRETREGSVLCTVGPRWAGASRSKRVIRRRHVGSRVVSGAGGLAVLRERGF